MVEHYLPNGEAGEEAREVSLRDFVSVVFRRKLIIIGVFLAALLIVFLLNARSEVKYQSEATIRISRGQQESAFTSRVRLLTWEEELNSEIETIQSQQIVKLAQAKVDDLNLRDSEGGEIKLTSANVSASTTGKSAVVYLSYRDPDPKAAQEGCRAVTEAYEDFRLQVRAVPAVEEFFDEEINSVRDQLDDWEQERARFMNEESVVRIQDERLNLLAIRQTAEVDLARIRAELAEVEAKGEVLRGRLTHGGDEADVYAFGDADEHDDQVLFRIRSELVLERSQMFDLMSQYTDDHPEVRAQRDRVAFLSEDLRKETRRYIRHMEARAEVIKAREDAILRTLRVVDTELSSLPEKEARLASFDRVLDQLKANYTALVDKQIQARIERSGSSDWNVLVLQPAGPALPIRVNDYVRMAIIPLLALVLGVALAFIVDGLDHTIKDSNEVESHLRVPVLGSVGKIR